MAGSYSDDLVVSCGVFHLFIYSSATTWMVLAEQTMRSFRKTYQTGKIKIKKNEKNNISTSPNHDLTL